MPVNYTEAEMAEKAREVIAACSSWTEEYYAGSQRHFEKLVDELEGNTAEKRTDCVSAMAWVLEQGRPYENGDTWIWCPWCRSFIASVDNDAEAYHHTEMHMDVAPYATDVEETFIEAPRFHSGAAVRDKEKDQSEVGTMRVLVLRDERAEEIAIPSISDEATVASVNEEYPAKGPVYMCIFEGYLDSNFPANWSKWADPDSGSEVTFGERVIAHAAEWGIPKRTYDYPAGRLFTRPTCPECGEREEFITLPIDDDFGLYACTNPDCDID